MAPQASARVTGTEEGNGRYSVSFRVFVANPAAQMQLFAKDKVNPRRRPWLLHTECRICARPRGPATLLHSPPNPDNPKPRCICRASSWARSRSCRRARPPRRRR